MSLLQRSCGSSMSSRKMMADSTLNREAGSRGRPRSKSLISCWTISDCSAGPLILWETGSNCASKSCSTICHTTSSGGSTNREESDTWEQTGATAKQLTRWPTTMLNEGDLQLHLPGSSKKTEGRYFLVSEIAVSNYAFRRELVSAT